MAEGNYDIQRMPRSRLATKDVYAISRFKHHVTCLLEVDVTHGREKLKKWRSEGSMVSFHGWILHAISTAISTHRETGAYSFGKNKLILFRNVNISFIVEKMIGGERVPLPVVIDQAEDKRIQEITSAIRDADHQAITRKDVVLARRSKWYELLYYYLPASMRRMVWNMLLRRPRLAYRIMGNVSVTSLAHLGPVHGWFVHGSVHPVSFGIGSVVKKPRVIDNKVCVREIMHLTVLMDHDVLDGAPMARFIKTLTRLIEKGPQSDRISRTNTHE